MDGLTAARLQQPGGYAALLAPARIHNFRLYLSFVEELAVIRSAATVWAYFSDVRRWISFGEDLEVHHFRAVPRLVIAFIRFERERTYRQEEVSPIP